MKKRNRYAPWGDIRKRLLAHEVKLRIVWNSWDEFGKADMRIQVYRPLDGATGRIAEDKSNYSLVGEYNPDTGTIFMTLSRRRLLCSSLEQAITKCVDFLEEAKAI